MGVNKINLNARRKRKQEEEERKMKEKKNKKEGEEFPPIKDYFLRIPSKLFSSFILPFD